MVKLVEKASAYKFVAVGEGVVYGGDKARWALMEQALDVRVIEGGAPKGDIGLFPCE